MDDRQELEELRRLEELETRAAAHNQSQIEEPNKTEAVVRTAGRGLLGGLTDEFGGVVDAALSKTGNLFLEDGQQNPYANQSLKQTYTQGRDAERVKEKALSDSLGGAALPIEIAGGIVSPVNKLGIIGAGAAQGLGYSEGENVAEVAKDTTLGGAIGGAIGKGTELVGKGLKAGSEAIANSTTAQKIKDFLLNNKYAKAFQGGDDVQKYVNPQEQQALANEISDTVNTKYNDAIKSHAQSRQTFTQDLGDKVLDNSTVIDESAKRLDRYGPVAVLTEAGEFGRLSSKEMDIIGNYYKALQNPRTAQETYAIWDDLGRRIQNLDGKKPEFQLQLETIRDGLKRNIHELSPEMAQADASMSRLIEQNKLLKPAQNETTAESFLSTLGGRNKGNRQDAFKEVLADKPELLNKVEDFQTYQSFNGQGGFGSDLGIRNLVGATLGGAAGYGASNDGAGGTIGTAVGAVLASPRSARFGLTKLGQAWKNTTGLSEKVLEGISPKYQQVLSEAANKGTRQLSITHFLLNQTDPEYQKEVSSSANSK